MSVEENTTGIFELFSELLSKEEYERLFKSLSEDDQTHFKNASLMYQRAMKCKKCDSDVCLALLCSSADAIWSHRIKSSHKRFKKFLMEYCPKKLRNPPLAFYRDFMPSEDYKKHQTSDEIRKRLKTSEPVTNSFGQALDFVYSRFRCYFLHEAIGLAGIPPKDDSVKGMIDASISPHFDFGFEKSLGIPIRIDSRTVEWFSNVVKESLVQYLKKNAEK